MSFTNSTTLQDFICSDPAIPVGLIVFIVLLTVSFCTLSLIQHMCYRRRMLIADEGVLLLKQSPRRRRNNSMNQPLQPFTLDSESVDLQLQIVEMERIATDGITGHFNEDPEVVHTMP